MTRTKDINAILSSTSARVLETRPSASVQLRITRDVLGDADLTAGAEACGIPENHPAFEMLRRVEFRESDVWMKTDMGGCVRGGVDDAFRSALNAGLSRAHPLIQDRIAKTAAFIELCETKGGRGTVLFK